MKKLTMVTLIFNLLFVVCACSGSEESQYTPQDNEEEFVIVEETGRPTIPLAQPRQEIVSSNSSTNEPSPKPQEIPRKSDTSQEKPEVKQRSDSAVKVTEPTQVQTAPKVHTEGQPTQTSQAKSAMMWSVQIGAFKDEPGAIRLAKEAKNQLNQPIYKDYDPVTGFYKVTVGSFATQEQASKYRMDVRSSGFPDAFTVEVRR